MAAAVLFLLFTVPYTLALLFDAVIEKYLTRTFVDSGSSSSLSLMPTMDLSWTNVDFVLVYCSLFVWHSHLVSLYLGNYYECFINLHNNQHCCAAFCNDLL